jgi:hypothetical protein
MEYGLTDMNAAISKNSKNKMMLVSKPGKIDSQADFVAKTNDAIKNRGVKGLLESQIGKK